VPTPGLKAYLLSHVASSTMKFGHNSLSIQHKISFDSPSENCICNYLKIICKFQTVKKKTCNDKWLLFGKVEIGNMRKQFRALVSVKI
jgi:hypothetical protein